MIAASTLLALALCSPGSPAQTPEHAMNQTQLTQFTTLSTRWKVAYECHGSGSSAIVLVHGWASDRKSWELVSEPLSKTHKLLAVDLLGHGESDKPATEYSMELFARGVLCALDAAGIKSAVFAGHSNGVPVIRQILRLAPERVRGLVFIDGPLAPLPEGVAQWMRKSLEAPDYDGLLEMLISQMPRGRVSDQQFDKLCADQRAMPRHVMLGGLAAMTDPAIWNEDLIRVPLAVLAAGKGHWNSDQAAVLQRLAPGTTPLVWDDVSHFLLLEEPERVARAIEDLTRRAPAND